MLISPSHIALIWEILIILGLVIIFALLTVYHWRNKSNKIAVKADDLVTFTKRQTNKEEARAIHEKIKELDTKLWETEEKLPQDEDLQKNPEIKHIMDELLSETDKLGHLINNREYDNWVETWLQVYSRFLHFHMDLRDENGVWSRARLNSKIRWFINHKVKK
jgi:hypothetical protein